MANFRWWTTDEDAMLQRLYTDPTKSQAEICAEIGRTWYSIVERAQRLKVHRPAGDAWTSEEVEHLVRLFSDSSVEREEIEAVIKRSWIAIEQKALRMTLKRPIRRRKKYNSCRKDLWKASEEDFLKQHYPEKHLSIEEIAQQLQRTSSAVMERAQKLGLRRPFPNKYSVNKRYFKDVRTEEQAYFLGLFAADGSVLKKGIIEIELQRRDGHLLDRFRNAIGPELPLKSKNGIRMSFSSVEMAMDLARYGIVPRKSYSFTWPQALPDELSMPFLLGYFDGDGSLKRGWPGQWSWELLGCYDFLLEARARLILHTHVKITQPIQAKPNVSPHLYRLCVSSAQKVIIIDRTLNASGLGLQRKHTSADDLFRLFTLTFYPEFRKTFRR